MTQSLVATKSLPFTRTQRELFQMLRGPETQVKFAHALEISPSQYSQFEAGFPPSVDMRQKVAKVAAEAGWPDGEVLRRLEQFAANFDRPATSSTPEDAIRFMREYAENLAFDVFLLGPFTLPVKTYPALRENWKIALRHKTDYHVFWALDEVDLRELRAVVEETFAIVQDIDDLSEDMGMIHHYAARLHDKGAADGESEKHFKSITDEFKQFTSSAEAGSLNGRVRFHNNGSAKAADNLDLYWQRFGSIGVNVPKDRTRRTYATLYLPGMKASLHAPPESSFVFFDEKQTGDLRVIVENLRKTLEVEPGKTQQTEESR